MGELVEAIPTEFRNHKIALHCYHIEQLSDYHWLELETAINVCTKTPRLSGEDRTASVEKFLKASEMSEKALCNHYKRLINELDSNKTEYAAFSGKVIEVLHNWTVKELKIDNEKWSLDDMAIKKLCNDE